MSIRSFTVAVPGTATSLSSLLQALSGWPTVNAAGVTSKMSTGSIAQVSFSTPTTNAGVIGVGGPGITLTSNRALNIPAGSLQQTLGSGTELALALWQIYVIAGTAGDLLEVGIIG